MHKVMYVRGAITTIMQEGITQLKEKVVTGVTRKVIYRRCVEAEKIERGGIKKITKILNSNENLKRKFLNPMAKSKAQTHQTNGQ